MLRHFIRVWKEFCGETENLFKNILCCRNIMLMAQPCNDEFVWSNMAKFVAFLIRAEVLSCDNFEFQCTAFYQKNWNTVIINQHIFLTLCFGLNVHFQLPNILINYYWIKYFNFNNFKFTQ